MVPLVLHSLWEKQAQGTDGLTKGMEAGQV